MNTFHQGFSPDVGNVACETYKAWLNGKISGNLRNVANEIEELLHESIASDSDDSDKSEFEEEREEERLLENWLISIESKANTLVKSTDKGDRDNLMKNDEFAKFFLNLCKTVPLWSSINCKFFNTEAKPSSSANIESYYNDTKCSLAHVIPGRVDEFVYEHIKLINGMVKNASQKYITLMQLILKQAPI